MRNLAASPRPIRPPTGRPAPVLSLVTPDWVPSANPWLIACSVMLATFMEVLDTSVANVALPHIAGDLAATTDESTWVLTSYLVANAIILPATSWLGRRFGRKRFLLTCILIFTLSSFLCGVAHSLGFLVFARILQGAGGGALQPMAMAILLESFPAEKRGQAMAAYGMGIVVAPILGPTLGGWITDNYSWRWIFYINLPIGIAATLMGRKYIEDPPYIRNAVRTRIDYIGFSLMALWLGCQEVVFDKGQEADWFHASYIVYLTLAAAVGALAFVIWELRVKSPIVNVRVLLNKNFATGTMLITVVGAILYGTTALLPLLLQTVMGYPALQSGLAVSPRGFGAVLAMMVVGRMVGKVDPRIMIGGGFLGLGLASYAFGRLTLDMSIASVIIPNIAMGVCVGFIFVPLTTLSTAALPPEEIGNATGIYNLMRNVGGGIGISSLDSLLARGTQTHQAMLVGHMTSYSSAFGRVLAALQAVLSPRIGMAQAGPASYHMVYETLQQQAAMLAYTDNFRFMALLAIACVPLVLLFRPRRQASGPVMMH